MDRGFPGQELKKLLKKIGISASPNCSCNKRAKFMDMQGIQWCEDNIDTIVEWLKEEAEKRRLPFVNIAAKILVKKAISNAKRKVKNMNHKIFVQIASYRDPELLPTLTDLLDKAEHPENLVIAIAWQHSSEDTWDNLDSFKDDDRFKIIDIDYKDSKGVCWARNLIQNLHTDEDYTLQLDSHHRFIDRWDTKLINMLNKLIIEGYNKPILTAYIPSYDPDNDPALRINKPWKMNFDRFAPEGVVMFMPGDFDDFDNVSRPLPARFYSAHFAFTLGSFCKEVPHDPEYYFHGEEISIAVRAYTHGYDLFHPHEVVAWHEYTRRNKPKHWSDDSKWSDKNNYSYMKNRKLFSMDGEIYNPSEFDKYGFGTVRTLADYEKYSGICFTKRGVQEHTLNRKPPPNPLLSEDEYVRSFLPFFKHCIDINFDKVIYNDYDVWAVAFENSSGVEIYRQDCYTEEIESMKKDKDNVCKIWRQFYTNDKPYKWIVWPHSISKGWCEKLEGII